MRLTASFKLEEFIRSDFADRHSIDNTPSDDIVANIKFLASGYLEPIRSHFRAPLIITSGYRSPGLNERVGGVENSAHTYGLAADFYIVGQNVNDVYRRIQMQSSEGKFPPYDQLILYDSWLHLGLPTGLDVSMFRGQALDARRK